MKKYMLTAKGRCLLNYLKKIIDGDWRVEDYIEAYEDTINDQHQCNNYIIVKILVKDIIE